MRTSRFSQSSLRSLAVAAVACCAAAQPNCGWAAASQWAHLNSAGRLAYQRTQAGDRIADFSYAGYMGGGIALPSVPVRKTIKPSGVDDTQAIQSALDEVGAMRPANGVRGAVLLTPGAFHCKGTLLIKASGVVLRGSGLGTGGSGSGGTTLELTGVPHLGISIVGLRNTQRIGDAVPLAETYVPSGAMSFRVRNASAFKAGDTILVTKPITAAWLHLMQMDTLVRNGKPQTWIAGELTTQRTIKSIAGDTLSVDVPLTDSYDSKYLGAGATTVAKVNVGGAISQVGVENLLIVAPAKKVMLFDPHFDGIAMKDAEDSWVRNVRIVDTTEGVSVGKGTRRVTIDGVDTSQSIPVQGAAKPADFSLAGTQILLNRCTGSGTNVFYVATMDREQGPNVVLNCVFQGDGHIQPHQRWETGFLVDGCEVPDGGIDLMSRGEMGSGHGWTMGWGVVWNSAAQSFVIQLPPGTINWAIGNRGEQATAPMPTFGDAPKLPPLPQGVIESQGTPVRPASLYLEQLKERLGPTALKAIGY